MYDRKIEIKSIRGGQVAPYKDSIYEYEIKVEKFSEEAIKEFCTIFLQPSINEYASGIFDGCSNFPFGLNSFYKFKKIDENKYHYIVCRPYTG